MDTLNPLICDIRDLKQLADQHGITCSIGTGGRLVIRPYRGPCVDVHAACVTRHDELRDHLIATRPAPFDPDKAADEAAWRVCRIPYQTLVALVIDELNTWLSRADAGLLAYEPPMPPRWDDGLMHDDRHEAEPTRAPRQKSARAITSNDRLVY